MRNLPRILALVIAFSTPCLTWVLQSGAQETAREDERNNGQAESSAVTSAAGQLGGGSRIVKSNGAATNECRESSRGIAAATATGESTVSTAVESIGQATTVPAPDRAGIV